MQNFCTKIPSESFLKNMIHELMDKTELFLSQKKTLFSPHEELGQDLTEWIFMN